MAKSRLSYIDLAVEDALRGYVLSARAAVLLSNAGDEILWANTEGARLLGSSDLRPLLDGEARSNAAVMRQIGAAASQLDQRDEAAAMVRARMGFKTQLVALGLTKQTLSNGDSAILVVSDELHGRRYDEDDQAQAAVEGLNGFGHGSAIIGETGNVIAASDNFATLDLADTQLAGLVDDVAKEDDRLVKRMINTPSGEVIVGLARLSDVPARHLLIVADGEADGEPSAATTTSAAVAAAAITAEVEPTPAEETDEPAAPVVGAFSNRRSRTEGMGRWYFKPRKEAEETETPAGTEPEIEAEANAEVETPSDMVADTSFDDEAVSSAEAEAQTETETETEPEPEPEPEPVVEATSSVEQATSVLNEADQDFSEERSAPLADDTSETERSDDTPTPDAPAEETPEEEEKSSSVGAVAAAATTAAAAAAAAGIAGSPEKSDADDGTEEMQTVTVVHKPTPPMAAPTSDDDIEETEDGVVVGSVDDVSGDEVADADTDNGDASGTSDVTAAHEDLDENTDASADETLAEGGDATDAEDDVEELATAEHASEAAEGATNPDAGVEAEDEGDSSIEQEGSGVDDAAAAATIAATAPSGDNLAADTVDEEGDGFRFASAARPVRFTWATGPDKVFTAVSKELADTVGPRASEVSGLAWTTVADRLGFDNGDLIDGLLEKGDTWSNRTVLWPVDGTDLRVPVDLAGLPSYDSARNFGGFNGFGIIRTADAVVDDRAAADVQDDTDDDLRELGSDYDVDADGAKADDEDIVSAVTAPIGFLKPSPSDDNAAEIDEDDASNGDSDKLRTLSSDESSNFRRIGETLSDSAAPNADGTDKAETEDESSASFIPSAFANRAIVDDNATYTEDDGTDDTTEKDDARSNVDTSILSRLPIPVLVYRDDELLFGNDEFFSTTGYADLEDLGQHGGVEALFADGDQQGLIRHRDGHDLAMHGNLQSVPWDSEKAMLLTLRHTPPSDGRGGGDGDGDSDGPGPQPGRTASAEPQETDRTNIMPFPRLAARGSNFVDDEGGTDTRSPLSPEVAARDILSLQVEEARQRMNLRDSGEKRATETTTIGSSGTATSEFTGLEADDLRAILDVSTDGVIIVSHEGIVRDINRSAEALFDVDADAIANRSITRLLAPESHRAALDYLANMGATGVASLLNDGREVVGKTSKGGLVPLFMTVGQLQHSDDCCAVVRDITHWKKAEEELLTTKAAAEGANELKTQFLAKISHEIRTPLNAIIGFSEMMIEERLGRIDNDRYRGYLRDINRSGNHVLDLVNDLLDITKIEAGKMEMDFDAVDLNRTVSENVAILQGDANAERIIIRTSLSTVVPKVVADQRSMRQIVLNLVSNSIKFTKSGGQVIVSTVYEDTGEVVLRVRDTGVGMTADEIEQALQPFRQTASSSVSESKGTGLGLPLTKALVEANRADFHIESTPDEGTLVEIHFPVQRVLADR